MQKTYWICGFALAGCITSSLHAGQPIDYTRDIKPLLTRKCYECHGPLKQRSGLRLDTANLMRKGGDNGPAIVPGKAKESWLVKMITSTGKVRMPPEGKRLEEKEINLIKAWIDQGAKAPADEVAVANWREHWAFRPPKRPAVPKVKNQAWIRNPIDAFVAAQHEKRGLKPSPSADKSILLRRVYLDLIGLPPTREELHSYLKEADANPRAAYEKVVDRLLKSPRYGERWGRHWMDIWRYSDWYGRRNQNEIRYSQYHIWRWRDWIIESVNEDKGYDRMIMEMLAGDEIAPADPKVLRATGFIGRNWYKFDRDVWLRETVEHTAKGFLALTMKCARCHDHKYDPIAQEDYYRFRAFFEPHDVRLDPVSAETILTKEGLPRVFDAKPNTPTYLFIRGDDRYPDKKNPLKPGVPKSLGRMKATIKTVSLPAEAWHPALRPSVVQSKLRAEQAKVTAVKADLEKARNEVATIQQKLENWTVLKKEPPTVAKKPSSGKVFLHDDFAKPRPELWKIGHGQWEYSGGKLLQKQVANWAMVTTVKNHPPNFMARVRYKTKAGGVYHSVGVAFDVVGLRDFQAIYTSFAGGRSSVQAFHRQNGKEVYPPAGIVPHPVKQDQEITLDIAVRDSLLNVEVNGELKIVYEMPMSRKPGKFAIWNHSGTAEFYEVRIEELPGDARLARQVNGGKKIVIKKSKKDWQRALESARASVYLAEKHFAATQAEVNSLQARIAAERGKYASSPSEDAKNLAETASKAERRAKLLRAEYTHANAEQHLSKTTASSPGKKNKAVVAAEKKMAAARNALTAARKAINNRSVKYAPIGKTFPKASTGRRLALAKWLASGNNPRTSRVAINHIWLRHFGSALVPTVANFGLSGKEPSHPGLLDWLAVEFEENGWSMKHIHRLIVTSATYQQTSQSPPAAAGGSIDPDNKYLWRMNAKRMQAEVVRDSLLHAAGQLDTTMGGPELSQKLGQTSRRRSIYFRLTQDDKMEFLELFDLANPNECYERKTSVVPQQSLALMNSALAMSQSRLLARKLVKDLGTGNKKVPDAVFVTAAFEHVLGRSPTAGEKQRCESFLKKQAGLLTTKNKLKSFRGTVRTTVPPSADPVLRARENLVHVLFNHNDFVTIR